jgi:hypothetical protein
MCMVPKLLFTTREKPIGGGKWCRRTTIGMRRWNLLPAHQISAAPAMDLYCRRTKKISAPGIKFEEIWLNSKNLGTLPPAHLYGGAPVVDNLPPAHHHRGAPGVRCLDFSLHPPRNHLFSFRKNKRK